jgi:hypothetical protein
MRFLSTCCRKTTSERSPKLPRGCGVIALLNYFCSIIRALNYDFIPVVDHWLNLESKYGDERSGRTRTERANLRCPLNQRATPSASNQRHYRDRLASYECDRISARWISKKPRRGCRRGPKSSALTEIAQLSCRPRCAGRGTRLRGCPGHLPDRHRSGEPQAA